tara:strand:+ start:104 stop:430 length:327 start_codon:yes stop_codon:yes gene_type:complete
MLVRREKSTGKKLAKKLYGTYKEKLWELMVRLIEEEIKNIGAWIQNITHLKEKIRKVIGSLIVITAGVVLVLFGLGELVASVFRWQNSIGYIMVGFIAIIVAIVYNKM